MKEYKLAKGWAVFIYVTTPLLIAAFGYLLVAPLLPGGEKLWSIYWLLAPLSLGMLALCVIGIIDAVKGRFVIEADRVYRKEVFATRELLFQQIAGYRTDDRYLYIVPLEPHRKQVKLSRYFGGVAEVEHWLSARYPNLDEQEAEQEAVAILSDETLGYTIEEREAQLAKARRQAKALNWAGAIVAAWTLFLTKPYEAATLVCAGLPLVCLLVSRYSKGLIRVEERKNSAYPNVFSGVFFPSLILCIRALMDFNLLHPTTAWKATLLLAALFMVLLLGKKVTDRRSAKEWGTLVGLGVISLAYGYGAAVTFNCSFDQSIPLQYRAKVNGKHVSKGKTTTYYLTLTAWGPQPEEDDVAVSRTLYNQVQVEETVQVFFRQGRLGISWFRISAEDSGSALPTAGKH